MDLPFAYEVPFVSQRKFAVVQTVAKHAVFAPPARTDFDFTHKAHELYPLYASLVRQYELIRDGNVKVDERGLLRRAIERARAAPTGGVRRAPTPAPAPVSAPASAPAIDWQNFIVLETVEFFTADLNGTSHLAPPLSRTEMQLVRDTPEQMFRSALTGELVPQSQYNEHIRAHQIDPEYYKQKEKEQKRSETNLDYDHVAENLRRLRQKRQKLD